MFHLHFDEIDSTQKFLKENFDRISSENNTKSIIISTRTQTNGFGRNQNKWNTFQNSITFSFSIEASEPFSITPIEIGVLIIKFINEKFNKKVFLKWPNDLFNSDFSKCGGMIAQTHSQNLVIVGVGINWGNINFENKSFRYTPSSIDSSFNFSIEDYKNIPHEIYHYIQKNRFTKNFDLIQHFQTHCLHMNKDVSITEDQKVISGKFIGIGEQGQALLDSNNKIFEIYNGTLTLN